MALDTVLLILWFFLFASLAISFVKGFNLSRNKQLLLGRKLFPGAALGALCWLIGNLIDDQRELGCVPIRGGGCPDLLPSLIKDQLDFWTVLIAVGVAVAMILLGSYIVKLLTHRYDDSLR